VEDQPSYCPALPRGAESEDDTMSDKNSFRDDLIKLGTDRPDLRDHIRPVLAQLQKEAAISRKMDRLLSKMDRASQELDGTFDDAVQGLIREDDGPSKDLAAETLRDQLELVLKDTKESLRYLKNNYGV